jgi:hypothetical protein
LHHPGYFTISTTLGVEPNFIAVCFCPHGNIKGAFKAMPRLRHALSIMAVAGRWLYNNRTICTNINESFEDGAIFVVFLFAIAWIFQRNYL